MSLTFVDPVSKGVLSNGNSTCAFGSLTYVGTGELILSALYEYGLSKDWETLYETVPRNRLGLVRTSPTTVPSN